MYARTTAKIQRAYEKRNDDWFKWRELVERVGIDPTLETLGFSTDRNALWYNVHTGSTKTLHTLITESIIGDVDKPDQPCNLAMELEHYLPQQGSMNPIVAAAAALTDEDVKDCAVRYLESYAVLAQDADAFLDSVCDMGASFDMGMFTCSSKTKGKLRVSLWDEREFVFPLRQIYQFIKRRGAQPALF